MASEIQETPAERLLTFRSGGWVILLAGVMVLITAGLVLWPVYTSGGFNQQMGDGRHVGTYGFDLSNLRIPASALVASGVPKDEIRAIPANLVETINPEAVDLIAKNEHIRFLVPKDDVVGVVINGEARAYPLRVLVLHELVNDVVGGKEGEGGVPIAVTYSPLSDSVVVFDRRIDGEGKPGVEFGVSGLLVDSTSVFFDRRGGAKGESLWPQLALGAVSGPAAGQKMTLIPYELTTWEAWTKEHPQTQVLEGLRRLKEEYGAEPYSTYRATEGLKFPVSPAWEMAGIPQKTRILVRSNDGGAHWTAGLAGMGAANMPANPYQIDASAFAWHALHDVDTDYSALLRK